MAIVVAMQMKINAQSTAVPNADFEQFLIATTSIGGTVDGFILDSEAAAVTGTLNLSNVAPYNAIDDFTGIEALTGITGIGITYNAVVTSLDVSGNTSLTILNTIGSTSLSSIVVGANTNLSELRIPGCPVGDLDLSANTGLTVVDVRQTNIVTLDMRNGNNASITSFNSSSNSNLNCIIVDDKAAGYLSGWNIGDGTLANNMSECPALSVATANELSFDVYPNPAKNRIYVASNLQESQIQVYDITGKLVLKTQMQFGENAIDISAMAPGVYVARILADGKSQTKKLIIQ